MKVLEKKKNKLENKKNKLENKKKKACDEQNQTTAPRSNLKKKKQNQFQHFSHTGRIDSPSTFKRRRIDSHFTFKNNEIDSPPTFKSHKIDSLLPLKVT